MSDHAAVRDHVRRWHGFRDHVDALKALAWFGLAGWTAVVFGLDLRYAPKEVEGIALSTWETTTVQAIETISSTLCENGLDARHHSELQQRLAKLVQEYVRVKGVAPFIPNRDCVDRGALGIRGVTPP